MERRRTNRYSLRMRANIQALGASAIMQPIETWTRDVSAKGLFLDMAEPFAVGTRIKIVLELPPEVVGTPVLLHCLSRVVRIVEKADGKLGVGAVIESYEFVHPGNA